MILRGGCVMIPRGGYVMIPRGGCVMIPRGGRVMIPKQNNTVQEFCLAIQVKGRGHTGQGEGPYRSRGGAIQVKGRGHVTSKQFQF